MPLSSRESRSEATARVTRALVAWLWTQDCRLLAPEVGLHTYKGLCTPWQGFWRGDLGAIWRQEAHLFEVKGSRADLAREAMDRGKWVHNWLAMGIRPWLVVDVKIGCQSPATGWGLMVVNAEGRLRVDVEAGTCDRGPRFNDYVQALGTVLCLQSLPQMMGRDSAQRLAALDGFERPWRLWTAEEREWRES